MGFFFLDVHTDDVMMRHALKNGYLVKLLLLLQLSENNSPWQFFPLVALRHHALCVNERLVFTLQTSRYMPT